MDDMQEENTVPPPPGLEQSPVAKVVGLLNDLKARVKKDGVTEQQSYDKYACWCEETTGRLSGNIADAEKNIARLSELVLKLEADTGSHGAEVKQLERDVAANQEAQKEARDAREAQLSEYSTGKVESEQCIGALEAAVKTLSGAGGQKGFLETMQEAQLLSVAARVRGVLGSSALSRVGKDQNVEAIRHFADRPQDFVRTRRTSGSSALQVNQNPFGDYAPQSTQIQGILKGLYDAFTADLEKSNAEEAENQKAFEELMSTKAAELATLQSSLQKQSADKASKAKLLADSKTEREDTQAEREADEALFEETKTSCKTKAEEWSRRSNLRSEELIGIKKALEVLTSEEASGTFGRAATTMIQLSSSRRSRAGQGRMAGTAARNRAFSRLQASSGRTGSLRLARIAAEVSTSGHFDDVIAMVTEMIGVLRKEEAADIAQRDQCQGDSNKQQNDLEDLAHDASKTSASIGRLEDAKAQTSTELEKLEEEMAALRTDMADRLTLRNKEKGDFQQALKDDTQAIALIGQAVDFLMAFYKRNKIPVALTQEDPEYSQDPNKAPETSWEGENYGGRKESGGIISTLGMIKQDLEMELKTGREDDVAAQQQYLEERKGMETVLQAQSETKAQLEKQLVDLEEKLNGDEASLAATQAESASGTAMMTSIKADCDWVKTHFESRRTKRQDELEALQDAKALLAGVQSGSESGAGELADAEATIDDAIVSKQ